MGTPLERLKRMVEKLNNSIAALDKGKTCSTCKHEDCDADSQPCSNCYNEILAMPVDPTKWEDK